MTSSFKHQSTQSLGVCSIVTTWKYMHLHRRLLIWIFLRYSSTIYPPKSQNSKNRPQQLVIIISKKVGLLKMTIWALFVKKWWRWRGIRLNHPIIRLKIATKSTCGVNWIRSRLSKARRNTPTKKVTYLSHTYKLPDHNFRDLQTFSADKIKKLATFLQSHL